MGKEGNKSRQGFRRFPLNTLFRSPFNSNLSVSLKVVCLVKGQFQVPSDMFIHDRLRSYVSAITRGH